MKEPIKTDEGAPPELSVEIKDGDTYLFSGYAREKVFSSGSAGYYCTGKMPSPVSGERYQVSINIVLIGSKPEN